MTADNNNTDAKFYNRSVSVVIKNKETDVSLYLPIKSVNGVYRHGYLLREYLLTEKENVQDTLTLKQTWQYGFKGVYIFFPYLPANDNDIKGFVTAVANSLKNSDYEDVRFAWFADPKKSNELSPPHVIEVSINNNTVTTAERHTFQLGNYSLLITKGNRISPNDAGNGFIFTCSDSQNTFGGVNDDIDLQKRTEIPDPLELILNAEPQQGCFRFSINISGEELDALNVGFDFFWQDKKWGKRHLNYPVFEVQNQGQSWPLKGVFDPLCAINEKAPKSFAELRTGFAFVDGDETGKAASLPSYFRTSFGKQIDLTPVTDESEDSLPALLTFNWVNKKQPKFSIALQGDFVVSAPTAPSSPRTRLMCGLQGNEYISLTPLSEGYAGDRLRFVGCRPAYVSCFPLPQASPVGPPVDPSKELLDDTFTTSWVTVVSAPGASPIPVYVAQPKGAPLYGQDQVINKKCSNLLGTMDPGIELEETACFPMLPYTRVSSKKVKVDLIGLFERQVISPTRRAKIGTGNPVPSALEHKLIDTEFNVTTPSGHLVTIDDTGRWTRILLAQLTHPKESQFFFQNPCPELRQAFQTSDLMLVVTNPTKLEKTDKDPEASFSNSLNIENWVLAAQVGENCRYGDYSNVIILKGVKGKLFDPDSAPESLAANPAKWSQKEDFAAPNGKMDELVPLSQWLLDYCNDAADKQKSDPDAPYFAKFNKIVQDENWTGILVLRAEIAAIPEQIKGITAGIDDQSLFYAHHFAFETSQTQIGDHGPEIKDSTSVSGLIYYEDPAYDSSNPEQPVPPPAGSVYDFRLLSLKVLFENSAVKQFQSYAQLTLNEFFGSSVSKMGDGGNMYNTIVLRGSYQNNNSQSVYSLGSVSDNTFYFDSNILNKVEVTSAQMSTRDVDGFLFNLSLEFVDDLNKGNVSYSLKQAFQSYHISVSQGARVIVREVDKTWQLVDADRQYLIASEAQNQLSVYGYPVSWFDLTGFVDFKIVQQSTENNTEIFDLFSFGNRDKEDLRRQGLSFSNLGLQMSYPADQPEQKTFEFKTSEIRFDPVTSTPRDNSLFDNFALQLEGLVAGSKDSTPSQQGYLPVITNLRLGGVDNGDWYGLRFRLDMGTPGELAGKVSLTSHLLVTWAPDSSGDNYKALVGIELPGTGGGAKLISLQNVLKLSIGQILLVYSKNEKEPNKGGFLLMLTEIALKFLGFMKIPPSGSTMFYLFGNPESKGKPSGLGWYAMYKQKESGDKTMETRRVECIESKGRA